MSAPGRHKLLWAERQWDLGTIDALAVGDQQPDSGIPGRLHQVTALVLPSPEAVNTAAERLAKAEQELTGQAGTPAGDAQRTASLLTTALAHYADHPGESCPVCAGRQLDEPWAADARQEISRLAVIAHEANAAVSERDGAAQALRTIAAVRAADSVPGSRPAGQRSRLAGRLAAVGEASDRGIPSRTLPLTHLASSPNSPPP